MNRREFLGTIATTIVAGIGCTQPIDGIAHNKSGRLKETVIPKRVLGKTGVEVSILALGGVIGMQLPPSKEHDPAAIAEKALNSGITYFDTAPSYNNGQSETNYGQVLSYRRKEVFLACKTGDRSYDGTMKSVEQSLKRLCTDHLDLLQIHGVTSREDMPAWGKSSGVYTALQKLREQKVIRYIGITGHDSADMLYRAIDMYEFDTLLTTLNPISRRRPYREKLLRLANEKRMGVIAMKVMGGGNGCLVTGNPYKKVLRPYHDETSHQVGAQSLIRYTLGLPISVAVIGVSDIEQLNTNVGIVKQIRPMNLVEREKLEKLMG
ncbi:MAG: aldo/keto reductase [Planctomycetota bacterium]|jgi:aryl-alcohol dehydrogenase-like predicted oxidoreductase